MAIRFGQLCRPAAGRVKGQRWGLPQWHSALLPDSLAYAMGLRTPVPAVLRDQRAVPKAGPQGIHPAFSLAAVCPCTDSEARGEDIQLPWAPLSPLLGLSGKILQNSD